MIGMNKIGDSLVIGPKFNLPKDLLEENRIDWIKYMQFYIKKIYFQLTQMNYIINRPDNFNQTILSLFLKYNKYIWYF